MDSGVDAGHKSSQQWKRGKVIATEAACFQIILGDKTLEKKKKNLQNFVLLNDIANVFIYFSFTWL